MFKSRRYKKIEELEKQIQENNLKEKEIIFKNNKECYENIKKIEFPEKLSTWWKISISKSWYSINSNKCFYIVSVDYWEHQYSGEKWVFQWYQWFKKWWFYNLIKTCNSSLLQWPINPTKDDKKISEHWKKLCNEYYIFLKDNNFYD